MAQTAAAGSARGGGARGPCCRHGVEGACRLMACDGMRPPPPPGHRPLARPLPQRASRRPRRASRSTTPLVREHNNALVWTISWPPSPARALRPTLRPRTPPCSGPETSRPVCCAVLVDPAASAQARFGAVKSLSSEQYFGRSGGRGTLMNPACVRAGTRH